MKYQEKAEEKFLTQEDERWEKEKEMEKKRSEADRLHELNMLSLILQTFQNQNQGGRAGGSRYPQ